MYFVQLIAVVSAHPEAHSLLARYDSSVSRSSVPGCRNPVDLTIEQTINRWAKASGGVVGFSRNVNAYYRCCIARHKSLMVSKPLTTSQKNVVQVRAEYNLISQLLMLSKEDIVKLFTYTMALFLWSVATADGGFIRTNKAQLRYHVKKFFSVTEDLQYRDVRTYHWWQHISAVNSVSFEEHSWTCKGCLTETSERQDCSLRNRLLLREQCQGSRQVTTWIIGKVPDWTSDKGNQRLQCFHAECRGYGSLG